MIDAIVDKHAKKKDEKLVKLENNAGLQDSKIEAIEEMVVDSEFRMASLKDELAGAVVKFEGIEQVQESLKDELFEMDQSVVATRGNMKQ